VTNGRNLEASLGYFNQPAAEHGGGGSAFGERIGPDRRGGDRPGGHRRWCCRPLALGHPPLISLALAGAFCAYGVIRKRVDASAQAGLLVECLFLFLPGLGYALWLSHQGAAMFGRGLASRCCSPAPGR